MQQHGQTVFMLEQLQPTWLATSSDRVVYTLCSRLIIGLLYGLTFGAPITWSGESIDVMIGSLTIGFTYGLIAAFLDLFRFVRVYLGRISAPCAHVLENYAA
jgi:hypothetical protein